MEMNYRWAAALAVVTSLAASGTAHAAPPTLSSIDSDNRHPVATFAAPGADSVTLYFASSPERSTDGSFLQENIVDLDFLTTDEIQGGYWYGGSQLDPGTYYVLLNASCPSYENPNCTEGFSTLATLTVPKPPMVFQGKVTAYRYLTSVDLSLTVTPLGEALPYRVCWTKANRRRKCVRGTVDGYSWNSSGQDTLDVRKRGMRKVTRFSWYVGGRRVATKRVRIKRA
jgi:hypothetical protein